MLITYNLLGVSISVNTVKKKITVEGTNSEFINNAVLDCFFEDVNIDFSDFNIIIK